MNPVQKALPELVRENVISTDTAQAINAYYQRRTKEPPNRLLLVFTILGSLLTGLGITLIIAHNWDDLSKPVKLALSLIPLALSQVICAIALFRKSDSRPWREGSALFMVLAICAAITMVSQVYHIEGTLEGFLFLWIILSFPALYVMRSSMVALLLISLVTWHGFADAYERSNPGISWWYLTFVAAMLPYYIFMMKQTGQNFFMFFTWLLALSMSLLLGMVGGEQPEILFVTYMCMFSLMAVLGSSNFYDPERFWGNGFVIVSNLGTVVILLMLSFEWFWNDVIEVTIKADESIISTTVLGVAALVLLVLKIVRREFNVSVAGYAFLPFILVYTLGNFDPYVAQILVNVLLLFFAVFTIKRGADRDRLIVLNFGLLIITAQVLCRFFDTDISFVLRGIMFVSLGAGFFGANYWMLRKRRKTAVS